MLKFSEIGMRREKIIVKKNKDREISSGIENRRVPLRGQSTGTLHDRQRIGQLGGLRSVKVIFSRRTDKDVIRRACLQRKVAQGFRQNLTTTSCRYADGDFETRVHQNIRFKTVGQAVHSLMGRRFSRQEHGKRVESV